MLLKPPQLVNPTRGGGGGKQTASKQRGRAVERAEVVDYEDYESDEWDE